MFKYKPHNKKVLIIPDKVQDKVGHIYSAELANKKPIRGKVIAVSEGSAYSEGDIVIYNRHAGQEMNLDDVDYLLMSEDDIYFTEHE